MEAAASLPAKLAPYTDDPEPVETDAEGVKWWAYYSGKSKNTRKRSERYVINSEGVVRCLEDDMLTSPSGTGGHTRTHHTDTTTLWGPEAKQKAINTFHTGRSGQKVEEAIALLYDAIGIQPPKAEDSSLKEENERLKQQVAEVTTQRDELGTKYSELETKYNELETKFALAREAFSL